jgi:hypothetical protein
LTFKRLLDCTVVAELEFFCEPFESGFKDEEEPFSQPFSPTLELEPRSSLLLDEISPIGSGAELLDSPLQATNKTAESNNAAKYFTEPPVTSIVFAKFKLLKQKTILFQIEKGGQRPPCINI